MKKRSLLELNRVTVEEFRKQQKTPIIVLLDNVRSALNVGAAFRTADAFALEGIALCGITAQPPHREILKTAIGATESISWTYYKTTLEAIQYYKQKGYTILAIEQAEGSTLLSDFQTTPEGKYVIILGNEVKGVSQEAVDAADNCLEIPQFGTKHSLNISVCAGIIVWELFQKLKISSNG